MIASAVRRGSFRISSPRQTLNQETDCVFPAKRAEEALGIRWPAAAFGSYGRSSSDSDRLSCSGSGRARHEAQR